MKNQQRHMFTSPKLRLAYRILSMFILFATFSVHGEVQSDQVSAHANVANKYASALSVRDYDAIDLLFDVDAFCDLLANRMYEGEVKKRLFKLRECAGFRNQSFSRMMLKTAEAIKFQVDYIGKNGVGKHTVRLAMEDGGLEFMELKFNGEKPPRISDVFVATKGQMMSRSTAEAIGLLNAQDQGVLQRLTGIKNVNQEMVKSFEDLSKFSSQGNFTEAYNVLTGLPNEIRNTRLILTLIVNYSQLVSETAYIEALSDLDKYFGDKASLSFTLLDYYFYENDVKKLDSALSNLKKRYLNDASVLNLEANLLFTQGQPVKALEVLSSAIEKEPNYQDSYWTKIYLLYSQDQIKEVISILGQLRSRFGAESVDKVIASDPLLAEFL